MYEDLIVHNRIQVMFGFGRSSNHLHFTNIFHHHLPFFIQKKETAWADEFQGRERVLEMKRSSREELGEGENDEIRLG